jgi:hypothetical protein
MSACPGLGGRAEKAHRNVNVRLRPLADITAGSRHVRFAPNSGHSSVRVGCRGFGRLSVLSNRRVARSSLGLFVLPQRGRELSDEWLHEKRPDQN